jgi:type I restriction enzyme S subunit
MTLIETTLTEVCRLVTDGTDDSPKLQESGVPFIKGKHISKGVIDFLNCDFITYEDHLEVIKRSKVEKGDILFSNIGTVGSTAYVDTDVEFSIKNVALFKPDRSKVDSKYLYYLVSSRNFQDDLLSKRSGVAQPFISLEMLRSHRFLCHGDKKTQKKISAILSDYDALIENNARRIKILEEMAQLIYREWFVHFRFPGHENVKMVESELGMIPEGWEIKSTDEVMGVLGGGTPSTQKPEYWDGGHVTWYSPVDLTKSKSMFMLESGKKITEAGLRFSSARLFPPYSVMLTSRATIGEVAVNTTEACTNQGFITCIPSDLLSTFQIYFWLLESIEQFKTLASGATFKELTKGTFRALRLVVPPRNISERFNQLVDPIVNLILNLQKKQVNLRQTRDLLLPKLISGKIDVSNLDIDTGAADEWPVMRS